MEFTLLCRSIFELCFNRWPSTKQLEMYKMPRKFDTCYGLLPMLTETQWGHSLYEFKFLFPIRSSKTLPVANQVRPRDISSPKLLDTSSRETLPALDISDKSFLDTCIQTLVYRPLIPSTMVSLRLMTGKSQ